MKYIITENQYKILLKEDRVEFLRNQNVVSPEQIERFQRSMVDRRDVSDIPDGDVEASDVERRPTGPKITAIQGEGGIDLAYIVNKKGKQQVKLTEPTFQIFVDADPSRNKKYVQWIIDVFKKHALHDLEEAQRFVVEDMDQATEALEQFDCIKETKKFRLNANDRPGAPNNPKDIQQYESVGQLYRVVSGFICGEDDDDGEDGDTGNLSKKGYKLFQDLMGYVKLGQAKLHKISNKVIIYQPQTLQSSCEPLGSLSNWCTRATPTGGIERETGGEWFYQYRGATGLQHRLRPSGELSDYYVIMPIELFQLEVPSSHSSYPYQIHFESDQLKDKTNSEIGKSGVTKLLKDYPELKDYFKKELGALVEMDVRRGTGLMDSSYIKYLNMFGGSAKDHISGEAYEEGVKNIQRLASELNVPLKQNKYLDKDNLEMVDFTDMKIKELPDLSEFKKLSHIVAGNCDINKFPPVDYLPAKSLTMLSLSNNNIQEIPGEGYEKLISLFAISAGGNPIKKVNTETLKRMCTSDDGTFVRLSFDPSGLEGENKEEFYKTKEEFCSGVIF
jgi:hypothetical protein